MSRWTSLAVLTAALCAVPAAGQIMQSDQLVPVVARTAGAGDPPTQWVSDLVVMNPAGTPLTIGIMYFPWGPGHVTGWSFAFPVTMTLGAQETRLVEDVLGTLFHFTGGTTGSLLVSCSNDHFPANPPNSRMIVASRTYNTGSPLGTFGQTVLPADLYANETAMPSYIIGARQDARFRSNLGIMNRSQQPVTVNYRIRNAAGSVVAQGFRRLETFDGVQMSFASLGVGSVTGALRVELWLDPADVTPDPCATGWANGFVAYVSKVDGNPQGTGDAEFLPAIPYDFPPPDFDCPGR